MAASPGDETRTNDRIRAREVRLIDPDGQQLGIKSLPEALSIARSMDLDLVEVAPEARPPVCRIMNFTKFKYEAQQRAKESRKKATNIIVKEMKYRPKIGSGDFETKTRKVAQFLTEGHKVKVTIMFRGREMQHPELGRRILDRVAAEVVNVGKVEIMAKQDGRNMTMVLGPDKKAQDMVKAQEKKASEAAAAAEHAEERMDAIMADATPEAPELVGISADGHTAQEAQEVETVESAEEVEAAEVVEEVLEAEAEIELEAEIEAVAEVEEVVETQEVIEEAENEAEPAVVGEAN
ncbi:MAG: translation initiation factor IF-3 [Actinobacteria bacterium]|nr:translation initiation factor IF-3 [Actinomycetota bacterium]MSV85322.1 translation initiation factor IF-3 [Actinomycetota bacterium]MSX75611.1 translation initiation factor IF-3 [Actinomycetota bacterium]MSY22446.1 translation initiation factor IF-3 [Actinomycetota bacterium]MTA74248.1 translation initiation factor IF-3 [Actinomycetota bacterium]